LKGTTAVNLFWTAAASPVDSDYIQLNNIFDFFQGAGGGVTCQPLYFDQWAAMYNNYIVKGAKVKAFVLNGVGSATQTVAAGVVPSIGVGLVGTPDSTSTPAIATNMSDPLAGLVQRADVYRIANCQTTSVGSYFPETLMLKRYYSMKKLFGRPLDNGLDGAAVTAGPTAQANCYIFIAGNQASASTIRTDVSVMVEIKFYVEFYSPKQLANS